MKKIGITGGIGSGKSIVCEIFKTLGIKVYNADIRAKELLDFNPSIMAEVQQFFGAEIYSTGKADRKLLAGKVFNNPESLKLLNSIIHPAVFNDFELWLTENKNESYVIKEAAIMFESGANKLLDAVVLVHSPLELKIQRVMERDKTDKDAVMARINNQMDEEEKMKLADFVIYNNEEESLIKQVISLHKKFNSI